MTLVIDASALTEILVENDPAQRAAVVAAVGTDPHWVVPEHFVIEVLSALRGRWLGAHVTRVDFEAAVDAVARFEFDVWPTAPLIPRIVELSANANSYDAAYVALAEELGCPLVTADSKVGRIPGIRCRVVGAVA